MDPTKAKLMATLAEINHRETRLSPSLMSVVGRHVYFSIAKQEFSEVSGNLDSALKQVLQHTEYSDRAVRLKLREMEAEGLIELAIRDTDRRSRCLTPTEKLMKIYETHAELAQNSIVSNFYIVEK